MLVKQTTFICILLIIMMNGCRSKKEVSATEGVLNLKTEREFFASFHENTLRYNTLSARLRFDIETSSGKSVGSRGQLKILKDDRLQLSVQPMLGIEAIRAELTPDSIKIVNRLNKWYMAEDFNNIKGNVAIEFNFSNLQALLTNRLFLPGEKELAVEHFNLFRWEQTQTGYTLRTNDRTGFMYTFSSDASEKLYSTDIKDRESPFSLNCEYSNFQPVDRQLFPMRINLRLNAENMTQYSLFLDFSQVEIDTPLSLNFQIPADYRQVGLQQILQSFDIQ